LADGQLKQVYALGNEALIPLSAILVHERDELSGGIGSRRPPRIDEQHQCEKTGDFAIARK
jgi:hypothetical protein